MKSWMIAIALFSATAANAEICILRATSYEGHLEKTCNGRTVESRPAGVKNSTEALSKALTSMTQVGYKIISQEAQTYTLQR